MMQPFQELIGKTTVGVAADEAKKGISFILQDGSLLHYRFSPVVSLAHIDNLANLAHGEILGVEGSFLKLDVAQAVQCMVNIDIRDQPESILRFDVDVARLVDSGASYDWVALLTDNVKDNLFLLREDF